MDSRQNGALLQHVRRLFGGGTVAGFAEGELLERFATRRDEAAFEALVERLGPMVLRVCRRILHDPHDTEDAFQATFLVLVKKARSIRDPSLLANWLYGVAVKVASRARAKAARRRVVEQSVQDQVEEEAIAMDGSASREPEHRELRTALDQEIGRLPESYRVPIVLCGFQGLTHEEAAARLRWPVGTVRSRMARGRDLLRRRLARRGVEVPAGVLAATLAAEAQAWTAVPSALIEVTTRIALRIAAGSAVGTVPASLEILTREVMKAMVLHKVKWVAVGAMTLAVVGGSAGVLARQGSDGRGTPAADGSPGGIEQQLKKALDQAKDYEVRLARQDREIRELRTQLDAVRKGQVSGGGSGGAMMMPGFSGGAGRAMGDRVGPDGKSMMGMGMGMAGPGGAGGMGMGMAGPGGAGGMGMGMMGPGMPGGFGGAMTNPNRNPNLPSVINDTTVLYQSPKQDRLVAFSIETGKRAAYRATKGTEKVNYIASGAILALDAEGPEITQIAVFDPEAGRWVTQDLKEPARGRVFPIVAQNLVAYPVGRRVYAYSNLPGASRDWAVLELAPGTEPKIAVRRTTITAETGDHLYLFSPKAGRWEELDPKSD